MVSQILSQAQVVLSHGSHHIPSGGIVLAIIVICIIIVGVAIGRRV